MFRLCFFGHGAKHPPSTSSQGGPSGKIRGSSCDTFFSSFKRMFVGSNWSPKAKASFYHWFQTMRNPMVIMICTQDHGICWTETDFGPILCEALSFRIGSGGQQWKTGGSSTLYGLGPFGPMFLPLEVGSRNQTGMGLQLFLMIFRMVFVIFSSDHGNLWDFTTFWHVLGVMMSENMKKYTGWVEVWALMCKGSRRLQNVPQRYGWYAACFR